MTWRARWASPVFAPALLETRARDNNRRDPGGAVAAVNYANYPTWRSGEVAGPVGFYGLRPRPVGDQSQRQQPERPRGGRWRLFTTPITRLGGLVTLPARWVSSVFAPALSETGARDNNRRDPEGPVTGVYYTNLPDLAV